jgi:hypothetical protein
VLEQALVRAFLGVATERVHNAVARLNGTLLYAEFLAWCEENGHPVLSHSCFSRRMKALGYVREKRSGAPVYYGLALRSSKQAQGPPRH